MQKKRNSLAAWLNNLQRESWNMELLISGFSIFLLLQVGPAIIHFKLWLSVKYGFVYPASAIIYSLLAAVQLASTLLVINMIIHILLRGFWIGAIGLRSVQEQVHYPSLKYTSYFTQKLMANALGLDKLILKLDVLSSSVFAFAFLAVFMVFSLFSGVCFFVALNYLLLFLSIQMGFTNSFPLSFAFTLIFLLGGGILYAIDTLSLGLIKKIPWLDRIYYPWYVFMGYVTFAFLYRNIYYTLLGRLNNWKGRLFLSFYIIAIFITPFFKYDQSVFFPDNITSANFRTSYYDNLRPLNQAIVHASIPSQIIKSRFLPLFIRYDVRHNAAIKQWCSGYEPSKKEGIISGIRLRGGLKIDPPFIKEKDPQKLLQCLSTFYNVYLDNKPQPKLEFWFYEHPVLKEEGIYTMIDLQGHQPGRHTLSIRRKSVNVTPEVKEEEYAAIPFWVE